MVLLILVDALSSVYLTKDNMPFLYEWSKKNTYITKIRASCGYCERTEIFTGMYPKTSNNFTAIGYFDKKNVYDNLGILKCLSFLERFSKKNTRRLANIYSKVTKKRMLAYQIPFQILDKFDLTEDYKSHDADDAFVGESLFTILRKNDKRYTMDMFTALGTTCKYMSDAERVVAAKRAMHDGYDFIPLYLGTIDTMGHKFVDSPDNMRKYLLEVDQYIELLIKESETIPDCKIVVLGDHGMEIVEDIVDVEEALKQIPLARYEDYDYFLDSTILRVWCNKKNQDIIRDKIDVLLGDKGFWIDEELAACYHIPFGKDKIYGDLVWCAKTGMLIYPDYFNKEIDHGMHGYATPTSRGKGLCIYTGDSTIIEEADLVDVCPILCKLLDIDIPSSCEGKII